MADPRRWSGKTRRKVRADGGTATLVGGHLAGESWPYLWLGDREDGFVSTIDWPELCRIADMVNDVRRRGSEVAE